MERCSCCHCLTKACKALQKSLGAECSPGYLTHSRVMLHDVCVAARRLASRLDALDVPQKPVISVLYGGMRKFKQVSGNAVPSHRLYVDRALH